MRGPPPLKPLGLLFAAKKPQEHRVRPPGHGEARVGIYNQEGVLLQEKLGTLSESGKVCWVRFEGMAHMATLKNGQWRFIVPAYREEP